MIPSAQLEYVTRRASPSAADVMEDARVVEPNATTKKAPSHTEQESRVFGLDVLRAAAILFVLIAHAPREETLPALKGLRSFAGFFGVELFFVLSGFLIGGILLRLFDASCSLKQVKSFWMRRWFRTLPNYLLFLIINSLLFLPKAQSADWQFLVFFQNLAWPQVQFFPESWSLAIEEWFYLILPLLLLAVHAVTRNKRAAFGLVICVVIVTVTAARQLYVKYGVAWSWDEVIRKMVVLRLDALMYGVLAAYVKHHWKSTWLSLRWPLAGIGIVGVAAVTVLYFSSPGAQARTLLLTLDSASIACLLPALDGWRRTTGRGVVWITAISVWSYSIYLCHLPIRELLFQVGGGMFNWGSGWNLFPLLVWFAATILVAKLIYRYFESNMTALRKRFA